MPVDDGIDDLDALGRQCFGQIFFADAIDAMSSKLFTPLIDKKALLVSWLWGDTIFFDVELKELRGFIFKLYEAESVSFPQYGHCFLLWVKIVEFQGGNLTSSCS